MQALSRLLSGKVNHDWACVNHELFQALLPKEAVIYFFLLLASDASRSQQKVVLPLYSTNQLAHSDSTGCPAPALSKIEKHPMCLCVELADNPRIRNIFFK